MEKPKQSDNTLKVDPNFKKRKRYMSFIGILRKLDLYETHYDGEPVYWDFVEILDVARPSIKR